MPEVRERGTNRDEKRREDKHTAVDMSVYILMGSSTYYGLSLMGVLIKNGIPGNITSGVRSVCSVV